MYWCPLTWLSIKTKMLLQNEKTQKSKSKMKSRMKMQLKLRKADFLWRCSTTSTKTHFAFAFFNKMLVNRTLTRLPTDLQTAKWLFSNLQFLFHPKNPILYGKTNLTKKVLFTLLWNECVKGSSAETEKLLYFDNLNDEFSKWSRWDLWIYCGKVARKSWKKCFGTAEDHERNEKYSISFFSLSQIIH